MKRIKYLLIAFVLMLAFSSNVMAASGSLSVNKSSVYVGDSFTVTANVNSAAAWNVHVTTSGPVSECSINQADATADAMDTNKKFSATCTATGEGIITITLSGDVTSASDGNAVGISGSKTVSVTTKPAPATNNNNSSNTNNNKSTNNKLKELSVDGYELTKVDNNNYKLSVSNEITSINVIAVAEDSKAKVSGAGKHELKVGENTIEIIVTAESGAKNKITIKVTRKDCYSLDNLEKLLSSDSNDINIKLNKNDTIPTDLLEKIKSSKKIVTLNYYDDNNKLIYSLIIDGSKISDINIINTSITFNNKDEIAKLANYPDGIFVNTDKSTKGIKIRIYVGDKYNNDDLVKVYGYKDNKIHLVSNNIKVVNGYIEFEGDGSTDYIITKSIINNTNNSKGLSCQKTIPIVFYIIPIVLLIFIILFLLYKLKRR